PLDGERARRAGIEAGRDVLIHARLEMKRQLVVELGARVRPPEGEVAEPCGVCTVRRHRTGSLRRGRDACCSRAPCPRPPRTPTTTWLPASSAAGRAR